MNAPASSPDGADNRRASGASRVSRSERIAVRMEQGHRALAALASSLTDAEWKSPIPRDGRSVGVVVHHVASMLPIEVDLAKLLAQGKPIEGVTWDVVHGINAGHAAGFAAVAKEAALELLTRNSAMAAAFVRSLHDEELDQAATVSLNANAPLTCQFFIEDHAMRHSYHHLEKIRGALGR